MVVAKRWVLEVRCCSMQLRLSWQYDFATASLACTVVGLGYRCGVTTGLLVSCNLGYRIGYNGLGYKYIASSGNQFASRDLGYRLGVTAGLLFSMA